MQEKRLYRTKDEKMIAGVCGGIAKYFQVDPSLVRIAVVLLCMYAGTGLLVYLIAAFIIPEEPAQ